MELLPPNQCEMAEDHFLSYTICLLGIEHGCRIRQVV